jgi:hypothetical protein
MDAQYPALLVKSVALGRAVSLDPQADGYQDRGVRDSVASLASMHKEHIVVEDEWIVRIEEYSPSGGL